MCRLLGYCSRGSASVAGLLTQEGLGEFTALSAFHADGWGMAWYDADGPQVRKSAAARGGGAGIRPAGPGARWATSAWCTCAGQRRAWASATPTPTRSASAPTPSPTTVPSTRRTGSARCCPPNGSSGSPGSTDSERYLLHIMWRLEARRGDMIAAVADTVASIAARYAVNSLNAVLLSPAKMYVISWHDPARIPADELRRRGLASTPEEVAGYFHLACLATPDAVVVASSGWPQPARLDHAAQQQRARGGPGHAAHVGVLPRACVPVAGRAVTCRSRAQRQGGPHGAGIGGIAVAHPARPGSHAVGGVSKPHRGPVARASLRSSVATREPRNSANATYQAS